MAATNVTLKVGSIYYELDLDDKKFKQKAQSVKSETKNVEKSFGSLSSSAKMLGSALGISLGIGTLVQTFRQALGAVQQFDQAMIGLQRTASRFGQDTDLANSSAKQLASDGLITITTAAEGLQKLMLSGLGLPEAIELMQGYKDQAAFGRSSTLSFDQAVGNLAESFYTENSMIGNLSGQTENWNMIIEKGAAVMGKSTDELSAQEKVLAKLYGQRQLNTIVEGDAAKAAETTSGTISKLNTQYFNFSAVLGQAIAPAVQMVAQSLTNLLAKATDFVSSHMQGLQIAAINLGATLMVVGQVIAGVAKSIYNVLSGNFEAAANDIFDMARGISDTVQTAQDKIVDTVAGSYSEQDDVVQASADNQVEIQSEKQKKLAKQLADETWNFEHELEKRNQKFSESLADLIFTHLDKVADIKKQLSDETDDFNENMSERAASFKEKMDEMVKDHEKKVKKLTEQMADEKEELAELEQDDLDTKQEALDKENALFEQRTKKLQAQIDEELAKGSEANKTRLALIQRELAEEIQGHEYKVDKINNTVDEQLEKQKEALAERLEDIQEQLDEETAAYEEQKTQAEIKEKEQTEKLKKEHDERISDYNQSLAAEQEILNRHQEEVNAVKDQAREDDISRLIRQHNEENAEAQMQHERRMVDLATQGAAEGATLGGAVAAGLTSQTENIEEAARKIAEKAAEELNSQAAKDSARRSGIDIIQEYFNGIISKAKEAYNSLPDIIKTGFSLELGAIKSWSGLSFLAEGANNFKGGMAVVGERGPELVRLPAGADVIPNRLSFPKGDSQTGSQSSSQERSTIINIGQVNEKSDVDMINRELAFKDSLIPGFTG